MKAYVIAHHGGPEVLRIEERRVPEPGRGEVRLHMQAAALNHLDLWVRKGVPGHRFPLPLIPGSDGVGTLDVLGEDVSGLRLGQSYIPAPGYGCGHCELCRGGEESLCRDYRILGESRDGTCAEYLTLPARALHPIPAGLTPTDATALPLTLMTTWRMLHRRAHLRPGESILVQAGGSGIGSTAIQIARALGCRVLTTVGSPAKAEKARQLGADEVILYRDVDVAQAVRDLVGKRGVDVVVEHTGAATWPASLRVLARGGRLVTCGATTGAEVHVDLRVLFFKQIALLGSTMGSQTDLREALALVSAGKLRPQVDRIYAMEDLAQAHQYLADRRAFGKVVLRGFGT